MKVLVEVTTLDCLFDDEPLWSAQAVAIPRVGEMIRWDLEYYKVIEVLWNVDFRKVTLVVRLIPFPSLKRGRIKWAKRKRKKEIK
jgi:hypothetical protein